MATEAQIAANRLNAQASTGPRTVEGKARTSRNAVSSGLFSIRDFVRPEEAAEYAELRDTLWDELHPSTLLETTQTAEIVSATWRLHRCAALETALDSTPDPVEAQKSIDRARTQAHGILLRATAELRRLRKDAPEPPAKTPKVPTAEQTQSPASLADLTLEEVESALAAIPRGAPCPCGSGQKYKRCCGRDAVGILNRAA